MHSIWSGAGLAHFFITMTLDRFGFLLIELGKFGAGFAVDPQSSSSLACSAKLSRRLALWINSVITNTASVATAFHSKVAGLKASHSRA